MNGKQSTRLRRTAESLAVRENEYEVAMARRGWDAGPEAGNPYTYIRLVDGCPRRIYKDLKRAYKRVAHR